MIDYEPTTRGAVELFDCRTGRTVITLPARLAWAARLICTAHDTARRMARRVGR